MKAFDKRSNGADVLDRLIRLYTTVGTDCSLCIGNVKLARWEFLIGEDISEC